MFAFWKADAPPSPPWVMFQLIPFGEVNLAVPLSCVPPRNVLWSEPDVQPLNCVIASAPEPVPFRLVNPVKGDTPL